MKLQLLVNSQKIQTMNTFKFVVCAALVFAACRKGVDKTPAPPPPPPVLYGDSVAFLARTYPQTFTNDINDTYLLGDSVYVPQDNCILTKMAFNIQDIGGYTTKCRFLVNSVEVRTIGLPQYRGTGYDSTFTFYDTVLLQKGWNFFKFTGYSWAPAKIIYSVYPGDVNIYNPNHSDSMTIIGLPINNIRKYQ